MAKKGIELPVNVLVIIVIAVMVLIALAALVAMGVVTATPIQIAAEKGGACARYSCGAVTASQVDVNINLGNSPEGTPFPRTLLGMCQYEKRCPTGTEDEVKKYCGGCIS
jgi:flagellar basal body-associated protein FliL